MKLEPLVEVIDATAVPVVADWDAVPAKLSPERINAARPYATEADRIAAATKPGFTTIQPLAKIKDDVEVDPDALDNNGRCYMCSTSSEEFFPGMQMYWNGELANAGVTWDPDLRL